LHGVLTVEGKQLFVCLCVCSEISFAD